jgi:hypothetical protein
MGAADSVALALPVFFSFIIPSLRQQLARRKPASCHIVGTVKEKGDLVHDTLVRLWGRVSAFIETVIAFDGAQWSVLVA